MHTADKVLPETMVTGFHDTYVLNQSVVLRLYYFAINLPMFLDQNVSGQCMTNNTGQLY